MGMTLVRLIVTPLALTLIATVILAAPESAGASPGSACIRLLGSSAKDGIEVAGVIGEPGSLTRTIRVHPAKGGRLKARAGSLRGTAQLDESQIMIKIADDRATIVVGGIVEPGSYHGRLTFLAGKRRCAAPLRVTARERPQLSPASGDSVNLALTRCVVVCDKQGTSAVALRDPGRALVTASHGRLKLYRDSTGEELQGLKAANVQIAGREAGTLLVNVDKPNLRAGHYTGTLLFNVEHESAPIGIAASADVKDGRTVPLLVIAFAFFVRLLAGYVRTRRVHQSLRDAVATADDNVRGLPADDAKTLLAHLHEASRRQADKDLVGAAALAEQITTWSALLREARHHQAGFPPEPPTPFLNAVQALRVAIAGGTPLVIDAAIANVRTVAFDSHAAVPDDSSIYNVPGANLGLESTKSSTITRRIRDALWSWIKRLVAVKHWGTTLLLNVLEVVIVLALTFLALQQTYFNTATFGADLLKDYGTLFVTALGATAAGRLVVGLVPRSLLTDAD